MPPAAIDPLKGPRLALSGRIVTMDAAFRVLPRGVLYVEKGGIVAVREAGGPAPAGFESVPVVATGGTVFPGLIELHNHLSYNALRLWDVPKAFTNRDQWAGTEAYRKGVTGPMKVLGLSPGLLPAVVRYVECKVLLGGVTTSQGIELFSNRGARRYYRGLVRNVEQTDEAELPEAATKIADVDASEARNFLARLGKKSCFLLHLSEGIDTPAREHFLALRVTPDEWAITDALSGIHCAALAKADFAVVAEHGGSMVWSPLSNLLLYGATAKIKDAKAEGVRIGIGSDWSPSGSKNLLGELKVARLVSHDVGGVLSDAEIVALATRDAAAILKWDKVLGSLEAGKRADLLVIEGATGDPYAALLEASETSIRLVMIHGAARFGVPAVMARLGADGESLRVGGRARRVFLTQETADPIVGAITLAAARDTLTDALRRLPDLARDIDAGRSGPRRARLDSGPPVWSLALDELLDTGMEVRPRLPLRGRRARPTGPSLHADRAAGPLADLVTPLELDRLTVADDEEFLGRVEAQRNLPAFVAAGLRQLYG